MPTTDLGRRLAEVEALGSAASGSPGSKEGGRRRCEEMDLLRSLLTVLFWLLLKVVALAVP
jgi:hypothetical protein